MKKKQKQAIIFTALALVGWYIIVAFPELRFNPGEMYIETRENISLGAVVIILIGVISSIDFQNN